MYTFWVLYIFFVFFRTKLYQLCYQHYNVCIRLYTWVLSEREGKIIAQLIPDIQYWFYLRIHELCLPSCVCVSSISIYLSRQMHTSCSKHTVTLFPLSPSLSPSFLHPLSDNSSARAPLRLCFLSHPFLWGYKLNFYTPLSIISYYKHLCCTSASSTW